MKSEKLARKYMLERVIDRVEGYTATEKLALFKKMLRGADIKLRTRFLKAISSSEEK